MKRVATMSTVWLVEFSLPGSCYQVHDTKEAEADPLLKDTPFGWRSSMVHLLPSP